jgi:hypothetical protein
MNTSTNNPMEAAEMRRFGGVFLLALLSICLAACAGPSGSSTTGTGMGSGTPTAVIPETHFKIQQTSVEGEFAHSFTVKNTGSGVLEILKITPG